MTYDGRRIHLHHFGILPEYQGKGLSKIVVNRIFQILQEKWVSGKAGGSFRTNIKAINHYQKVGFVRLGDYDVYIIRDIYKLPYSQ